MCNISFIHTYIHTYRYIVRLPSSYCFCMGSHILIFNWFDDLHMLYHLTLLIVGAIRELQSFASISLHVHFHLMPTSCAGCCHDFFCLSKNGWWLFDLSAKDREPMLLVILRKQDKMEMASARCVSQQLAKRNSLSFLLSFCRHE